MKVGVTTAAAAGAGAPVVVVVGSTGNDTVIGLSVSIVVCTST